MKDSMESLEEQLEAEMSQELKNYIRSYIATWRGQEKPTSTSVADAKLPRDWVFYVRNGLYASEKAYAAFLAKSGLAELPRLLCIMEGLQPYSRCIFQTDDDPRKLPFPPAFQAAFVKVAEELALSDDSANRGYACDVFRLLLDMGMSRIHQSASCNDFHVLPIADWISVFEKTPKTDAEKRKADFRYSCVAAYAQSWIRIYYEMEEWAGSNWPFTRENEMSKERDILDWLHTLRTIRYCSSCVYLRCLESTDISWLPYLFKYVYAQDRYGFGEYFPLNFQRAFAKFCRHYVNREDKPENYKSIADALDVLSGLCGLTILDEKNVVSSCKDATVVPLEAYVQSGLPLREFIIKDWSEHFGALYDSCIERQEDVGVGVSKDSYEHEAYGDTVWENSIAGKIVKSLRAGWRLYRVQFLTRIGLVDKPYRAWRAKPPVLFFSSLKETNYFHPGTGVSSLLFNAMWICAFVYGIKYWSEWSSNYWLWATAGLSLVLFREIHIFSSCCIYSLVMNRERWKEEEASYLDGCREEYCLNSYGGDFINNAEFNRAVRCSLDMSRLVGWIGPVLEAYGDISLMENIVHDLWHAQRVLFQDALPHNSKQWPRPFKHNTNEDCDADVKSAL